MWFRSYFIYKITSNSIKSN